MTYQPRGYGDTRTIKPLTAIERYLEAYISTDQYQAQRQLNLTDFSKDNYFDKLRSFLFTEQYLSKKPVYPGRTAPEIGDFNCKYLGTKLHQILQRGDTSTYRKQGNQIGHYLQRLYEPKKYINKNDDEVPYTCDFEHTMQKKRNT